MSDEAVPPPPPVRGSAGPAPQVSQAAVWSLVLGILSTFCLWILGSLPAIILGILAMRKIEQSQGRLAGKGLALAGVITGSVGILSGLMMLGIVAGVTVPAFSSAKQNALEAHQMSDMRQIALACLTYASENDGNLPPDLESLVPDYLESPEILNVRNVPVDPGTSLRYLYRPGLSTSASRPFEELFLLSPVTLRDRRVGAFLDGHVERILEPVSPELLDQFE